MGGAVALVTFHCIVILVKKAEQMLNLFRIGRYFSQMSKESSTRTDQGRPYWMLEDHVKGHPELEELLQSLRASEHKYRTILEELDLGFLEVDLNGVITRCHPRFTAITGYSAQDLVGKQGSFLLDEEGMRIMTKIIAKRKQGEASSYELPIRHKLGHRIWLLITGAPLKSLEGQIMGSVGIHFDVTARKELELENQRALASEAMARQRERELLMKMSHEIRTPINAINGLFHLLDIKSWSPEELQLWQGAQKASAMLRVVVDDILQLTKLESGKHTVNKTSVNVVEVTAGLAKMHHLLAEQKGLELDCVCRLITKNRVIDVDKWLQILTNLLGNAIKFTERGKVRLDIYEDKSRPDWIYAEVSDTGPGINVEDRDNVFMPFGGDGAGHISEMGSSGLGLAISRELALLMGGDLMLMPSKQGARFVLELPAETWSEHSSTPSTPSAPSVPAVMDWDGSGIKVLMAEDNELNIMYAKALLQRWKVTFDVVPNGAEALEHMKSNDYDLVLLDVQMPVMDGMETLQRIRSTEQREGSATTPVYMVTAFADDETRTKALDEGASGFVAKPFAPAELREVLSQVTKKG